MVKPSRLYQRVFLLNAAIFVLATLVLVVTPATISFPVEVTEAIVVAVGLAALLTVNAFVLRAAFAPLDRLTRLMRTVDPYRPGARLEVAGTRDIQELITVFNDMLDRLESERRRSGLRALAAQEDERRRVARDLHDEVGQLLTGVLVQLESLAQRAPTSLASDLRATQEAARSAIDHVSRVVRELRPEALDDLGLANALVALAARVEQQTGLRVRHRIGREIGDLGHERELVIYRIAQESLTNAARHAHATSAVITLERHPGVLRMRVRDDGIGLPQAHANIDRHGLSGMHERALLVGASVRVDNASPSGVEVTLTMPIEQ